MINPQVIQSSSRVHGQKAIFVKGEQTVMRRLPTERYDVVSDLSVGEAFSSLASQGSTERTARLDWKRV